MTVPGELSSEQVGAQQPIAGNPVEPSSSPQVQEPPKSEETPTNGAQKTNGKFVELHHSDFKKIKDDARQKGHNAATAYYAEKAESLGFDSVDDMLEAAAKARELEAKLANPPPEPKPEPQIDDEELEVADEQKKKASSTNGANGKSKTLTPRQRRQQRELARERADKEKAMRKWRAEEKKRRDLQKQLDAKDAEISLRETAVAAGVKDVDYSLRLLTRHLKGKSAEEIASFDEQEYFTVLRKEKPYLFGEHVAPATTGNGAQDAPPSPKAEDVQNQVTDGAQFDARTAKPEDVSKRLKQLGLNPHM